MNLHAFNPTSHRLELPDIVRAGGVHVETSDGRRYVDLESGVWCLPLGHNHPRVNDTIMAQRSTIRHAGLCCTSPGRPLA